MAKLISRSRGRRSLLALLQLATELDVAARCRVAQQSVSDWAAGNKRPSERARMALQHVYGITATHWDQELIRPQAKR
jgi:transcriptional regulator with XRE-family HTH domain